jgi:hypothetical protein
VLSSKKRDGAARGNRGRFSLGTTDETIRLTAAGQKTGPVWRPGLLVALGGNEEGKHHVPLRCALKPHQVAPKIGKIVRIAGSARVRACFRS